MGNKNSLVKKIEHLQSNHICLNLCQSCEEEKRQLYFAPELWNIKNTDESYTVWLNKKTCHSILCIRNNKKKCCIYNNDN